MDAVVRRWLQGLSVGARCAVAIQLLEGRARVCKKRIRPDINGRSRQKKQPGIRDWLASNSNRLSLNQPPHKHTHTQQVRLGWS